MEKTKAFFKKYWSTILIYAALILFYWAMTSSGKLNAYLFPKIGAIGRAFYDNRDNMLVNLVSSIGMMIPSIIISIVVALSIGNDDGDDYGWVSSCLLKTRGLPAYYPCCRKKPCLWRLSSGTDTRLTYR